MVYLFKDQCVTYTTAGAAVETDDDITSDGYKVKVGGVYVTGMRGISPVADTEVDISIEDLIETPRDRWVSSILSMTLPVFTKADFVDAEVEFYQLVFNKNTGATVETYIGNAPFNNIIHGVFGNRFQNNMNPQSSSKFIWCGGKFMNGGYYRLHPSSIDLISIIPKEAGMAVRIIDLPTGGLVVQTLTQDAINVISVRAADYAGASTYKKYKVSLTDASINLLWECTFEVGTFADHRRLRGTPCDVQPVNTAMTLYFEHPWGGLDSIGNLNLTGVGVPGNRRVVRLQKPYYRRGGNASETHIPSQAPSVFTAGRDHITAESNMTYTYESIYYGLDYQWLGMLKASKRGYLKRSTPGFTGLIEVFINDVSVSTDRDENDNLFHVVTVQIQETVEIYS